MMGSSKPIICFSFKEEDCFVSIVYLCMGKKSKSYAGSSALLLTVKLKGTSFPQRKVTNEVSL